MQTARRAAAPIADAGDDGVSCLNFVDDMRVGRGAVVRFLAPYDTCNTQILAQRVLKMREVAVRDEADRLAPQRGRSFC
jgi:hypothetical protein